VFRAAVWALALTCAIVLVGGEGSDGGLWAGVAMATQTATAPKAAGSSGGVAPAEPGGTSRFAVGELVVGYTDPSRRVRFPGRRPVPRPLVTVIRYPAEGSPSRVDIRGAPAAKNQGPYPLIVFGHGFAVSPALYAPLLRAWASAGYVVAAPIFPLSNANAPGGPDESDLVNQPTDMSVVITRLLTADASGHGILSGLIDSHQIAVAGQSDGGSTALAVAYNSHYVDRRIGAAVILSGAEIPGVGGYNFPAPSPPLLAAQGAADIMNAPSSTYAFYRIAPPPKFLLSLLGAPHLAPYTTEQPQLAIVERVSVAFLDRYLKHGPGARARMWTAGDVSGVATLSAGH
jgi:dienelactone hydrolase